MTHQNRDKNKSIFCIKWSRNGKKQCLVLCGLAWLTNTLMISYTYFVIFSNIKILQLNLLVQSEISGRNIWPITRDSFFAFWKPPFSSGCIMCSWHCFRRPNVNPLDVTRIYKAAGWEAMCPRPYLTLFMPRQFSYGQIFFLHPFRVTCLHVPVFKYLLVMSSRAFTLAPILFFSPMKNIHVAWFVKIFVLEDYLDFSSIILKPGVISFKWLQLMNFRTICMYIRQAAGRDFQSLASKVLTRNQQSGNPNIVHLWRFGQTTCKGSCLQFDPFIPLQVPSCFPDLRFDIQYPFLFSWLYLLGFRPPCNSSRVDLIVPMQVASWFLDLELLLYLRGTFIASIFLKLVHGQNVHDI